MNKWSSAGLALALGIALDAGAQPAPGAPVSLVFRGLENVSTRDLEYAEVMAEYGHPNEMWRVRALMAVKRGDLPGAVDRLRLAARYADKLSQHSLSLMYWHGVGVEIDHAKAYVWSELAAERGYPRLEQARNAMWLALDDADRERAASLRAQWVAEYGDEVAKPRAERAMTMALNEVTGSRIGASRGWVQFASVNGRPVPTAEDYFAEYRWNPETYWEVEEIKWNAKVIVGDSEKVRPPAEAPERDAGDEGGE